MLIAANKINKNSKKYEGTFVIDPTELMSPNNPISENIYIIPYYKDPNDDLSKCSRVRFELGKIQNNDEDNFIPYLKIASENVNIVSELFLKSIFNDNGNYVKSISEKISNFSIKENSVMKTYSIVSNNNIDIIDLPNFRRCKINIQISNYGSENKENILKQINVGPNCNLAISSETPDYSKQAVLPEITNFNKLNSFLARGFIIDNLTDVKISNISLYECKVKNNINIKADDRILIRETVFDNRKIYLQGKDVFLAGTFIPGDLYIDSFEVTYYSDGEPKIKLLKNTNILKVSEMRLNGNLVIETLDTDFLHINAPRCTTIEILNLTKDLRVYSTMACNLIYKNSTYNLGPKEVYIKKIGGLNGNE